MKSNVQSVSLQDIKGKDLVSYLASLGFQYSKIRGDNYWYLSPLREEKTPSFKVSKKLNRWYDFGLGVGGSIIDFGIRYFNCTIAEFAQSFTRSHLLPVHTIQAKSQDISRDGKIIIKDVFSIRSKALEQYIKSRAIDLDLARQFCVETVFELYHKKWFAVGFQNDQGGFELRNQFFKGSSSPKTMRTLLSQSDNLAVFEGFFDFLSYQMLYAKTSLKQSDFLILNSLSFANQSSDFISSYESVDLFLDHGKAGQNCSHDLMSIGKHIHDLSSIYKGYDDFNECLVKAGLSTLIKRSGQMSLSLDRQSSNKPGFGL